MLLSTEYLFILIVSWSPLINCAKYDTSLCPISWVTDSNDVESEGFIEVPVINDVQSILGQPTTLIPIKRYQDLSNVETSYFSQKINLSQGNESQPERILSIALILLSGGPGQPMDVWQDDIPIIRSKILKNITGYSIYTIEQRGILMEKIMSNPNCQSTSTLDKIPSNLYNSTNTDDPMVLHSRESASMDPRYYSQTVYDVVHLGNTLKKTGVKKLMLVGVSFGAFIGARAAGIDPHLFDWVILDSPSVVDEKYRFGRDIDEMFWKKCINDRKCGKNIRWSVEKGRDLYKRAMYGSNMNECSSYLEKITNSDFFSFIKSVALTKPLEAPYFIREILDCRSAPKFRKRVGEFINELNSDPVKEESSTSKLVNSIVVCSEIFNFKNRPNPPNICKKDKVIPFYEPCRQWAYYYKDHYVGADINKLVYDPVLIEGSQQIVAEKTKFVLLTGNLDMIVSPVASERWFNDQIISPFKVHLNDPDGGHSLFAQSKCLNMAIRALITKDLNPENIKKKFTKCILQ